MKKNFAFLAALFAALLFLSGCESLGIAPAKSFDQKLAYAYGANTAALEAATSSLNAGTLKSADMEKVMQLHDQVRATLDAAKLAADAGDTQTAGTKLAIALTTLSELQQYLRTRNATKGG